MLYNLFSHFNHIAGAGLWQYISFRALVAAGLGLLLSIVLGKYFIAFMRKRNISETQRDAKLDPFGVSKKGVPTMGGLVILIATILPCLLVGKLANIYLILMLITTLLLGSLGFADDYIKTFRHNKEGLNGWVKIIGQVALGLIVGLTLRYAPEAVMMPQGIGDSTLEAVKSTQTTIPFFKHNNFNYADLFSWMGTEWKYRAGWIFFVCLTIFVVAAVSNGANLNDGMDGMCAGNSALMATALLLLAYASGNTIWANYFDIMYIPGSEELVVFLGAFIGALVGFLWYNSYPAQVFMGDTGSLAIGGIIAVSALIIHKELLIPVLCGVFLMESVSVILQTQIYKLNKRRGKHVRIWRRTPFHDHFRTSMEKVHALDPTSTVRFSDDSELHHETKIVLRFCIVTLILAAFTILTLKIR